MSAPGASRRSRGRRAGDQRLQLALEAGGLGTWDWDLRGDHIVWDERTASIFGIPLEEFDGTLEMFRTLVHTDDVAALIAAIEQAIATCGTFQRDYRVVTRGGETRWVSVRGRVACDEDGQPESMVGVAQDRSATHSLAERLGRTLETMDEAFFSLDHDWRFTYVNAMAEALLQRTREELLGRPLWEEFPEAVGSEFERRYREVAASGEAATFEAQYGPLATWFEVRTYPDPAGIAVYFRDINDRRERERRRERAHDAAARLLDRAPVLREGISADAASAAVCAVATEVFSCTWASLWLVEADKATLTDQCGGVDALPVGATVRVEEVAGLAAALAAQEPRFVADAQAAPEPEQRELARREGIRSLVHAPIQLGSSAQALLISLGWDGIVDAPDEAMLGVVQRFAHESALALAQARRREAQQQAVHLNAQLQSSLLPSPRVQRRELSVDALYRTGERRLMLGGDFYDCLELDDGSTAMVIGDVTGHGPEAAAVGATLRAAWRALALHGLPPAPKVAALDELLRAERDTDEQMVSVCCTVISPDLRSAVIASAGHPPPILVDATGARLLEVPAGILLGAPAPITEPPAAIVELPARWAILLYTDGLPEARCRGGDDRLGLERFAARVADVDALTSGGEPLEALDRRVRAEAAPIDDDVALLLVRRER